MIEEIDELCARIARHRALRVYAMRGARYFRRCSDPRSASIMVAIARAHSRRALALFRKARAEADRATRLIFDAERREIH